MKLFTFLLITLFGLNACSNTTSPTTPQNTVHWSEVIDYEANLYRIDDKLYRSEQLLPDHYALLKQNDIKTLINLRFFDRNDDRQAFGQYPLTLINTPLLTWHITPKEVAEVLWQIEQQQKQGAVLIHCYHGADRTGLISAMYRVIYQGWSLPKAKLEMTQGPYGFHSIWKNIEGFFTEENVAEIQAHLAELRAKQ
ncbi:tyrosine-protein phosphatase [Conservatibacter flavescens]|uniref:Protein-tyrosine-phosphatase n=1 Tax=Conservatibacter flavescens TaxID=28161 RepID=A0A2M8S2Z6_9PAST|nr:tyrosine-protein phosphatase [Conservatibacter flavescens]PJG85519.1 protein-tyrosine-phosphatase [Conservatibacter flavescens]